jgi:hypothetical protein
MMNEDNGDRALAPFSSFALIPSKFEIFVYHHEHQHRRPRRQTSQFSIEIDPKRDRHSHPLSHLT